MPTVTIMTFGYSYGGPGEGFAHVADVRNVAAARGATPDNNGNDPEIKQSIMANSKAKAWLEKMKKWSLKDGDKVAIGCSRGHHRSVAIANAYASWLRSQGWTVKMQNRDMTKQYSKVDIVIDVLLYQADLEALNNG